MSLGLGGGGSTDPGRRVLRSTRAPTAQRRARRAGWCLLAACSLMSLASAGAEPPPDAATEGRARALFKEGNRLIEQSRYVDALDRFLAAYSTWQNPKIKLNIATTLRALGRYSRALTAYREYLRDADPSEQRQGEVEAIARGLEAHVARLDLHVGRDVERVTLDGEALDPRSQADLLVDPGRHVLITETAAGAQVVAFDVVAGERRPIGLPGRHGEALGPTHAATPDAAPPNETLRDAAPDASVRRSATVGVVTRLDVDGGGRGAVGAAGLTFPFGRHVRASLGGLLGAHAGGWAGLELSLFDARLSPTLGVSVPVFFVEGPRLGVSTELGARWALSQDFLFVALRAALVHFPRAPEAYGATVVVPSLSTELWL